MDCRLGRWDGQIGAGIALRGELFLTIDDALARVERGLLGEGDKAVGFGSAWDVEHPERHANERKAGRDARGDLKPSSLGLSARDQAGLMHVTEVAE